MPVRKGASCKEVGLCIIKISFYSGLPVGISHSMGDEGDAENIAEALHLRGDVCIRTTPVGHNDTGVVDHASRACAVHKPEGLCEENLGFKACKRRIILNEQFSRTCEDEARALRLDFPAAHDHRMRRRVMLHLLSRAEVIGPGAILFLIFSETQFPRESGQAAVGDRVPMRLLQDFLDTNHIAQQGLNRF